MRKRMNATAEQIQGIKDLCSAQQELGVIGDEVQLAGAQQLATFLNTREALETLIPVMNDIAAQQSGLAATASDTRNAATLLGKAMAGNTTALQRMGIYLSDSQKQLLAHGIESEKAAMLAEVFANKVGHMNAELAQTDAGKQKQLANAMGDVGEKVGAALMSVAPYVALAAQLTTASTGVVKLTVGIKGLVVALKAACVGTTALGTAIRTALITSGIVAVIWGICQGLNALIGATDDAADSMQELSEAEKAAQAAGEALANIQRTEVETAMQARLQIEQHIEAIKNFNGGKEAEKKLINELNGVYGTTIGQYKTLSGWYNALIKNSEAYCQQMVLEAQTRMLAENIAKSSADYYALTGTVYEMPKPRQQHSNTTVAVGSVLEKSIDAYNSLSEKDRKGLDFIASHFGTDLIKEQMPELKGLAVGSKEIADLEARFAILSNADKMVRLLYDLQKRQAKITFTPVEEPPTPEVDRTIPLTPASSQGYKYDPSIPVSELKTFEELEAAKKYYSERLQKSEADDRREIQETIAQIDEIKKAWINTPIHKEDIAANPELSLDDVKAIGTSYNVIGAYRDALQQKLNEADEAERAQWEEKIRLVDEYTDSIQKAKEYKPGDVGSTNTLGDLNKAIGYYQQQMQTASAAELVEIQKTIDAYGKKKEAMGRDLEIYGYQKDLDGLQKLSGGELKFAVKAYGLDKIRENIMHLKALLADTENPLTDEQRENVENQISDWSKFESKLTNVGDAFGQIGNAMSGLGKALELPELNYAGVMAQAIATMIQGYATATTQSAALGPFAWIAFAATGLATLATMISQVKSIGTFANGGIAYGPTLGLFGEYAGASNNPEVVAPLDKLRSLIEPRSAVAGDVEFYIDGRVLRGVLRNTDKLSYRS